MSEDFDILIQQGNIAFYQSCEITEIFLYRKQDKLAFNFFTIVVFEEKLFEGKEQKNLTCKLIPIDGDHSLGIGRYRLSMEEITTKFRCLKNKNQWSHDDLSVLHFPQLRYLPKQFIPVTEGVRLNKILKNNFHSGAYTLEFFDESKRDVSFLLKDGLIKKFNKLCEEIKRYISIELSVARDRIGNFIFQFPITLLDVEPKALPNWDGVDLKFAWHSLLSDIPDCLLQVESIYDKNYMGCMIHDYNKDSEQRINIGNLDQINHIKIWRKEPGLILYNYSGTFFREFVFAMSIVNPEPRIFEVEGHITTVQVANRDRNQSKKTKVDYTIHISNNLYDAGKRQLEESLSFKQYKQKASNALDDIRTLIKRYDENGVYLWDPFLTSSDILKTLFFSPTSNVPLRAIGAITDTVKTVYNRKGKTIDDVVLEYRNQLENPQNNNLCLNLEFRVQHTIYGRGFHDRFLIFPGKDGLDKPRVYSLGTSINSYGQNHHILQEVSYPQPVVDAFNELWEELDNKNCIVWKYPK